MIFTIYTLGDLSSMTAMLNAVAMVFNDPIFNDPGSLGGSAVRLVALAVLAGVILSGMMTMWRNGQGSPTILLIMFVLWTSLGLTKATVVVQDVYSGTTTTVDNVPLIVAVPGGVFTTVGQVLGEKMQTAFSSVDSTAPALSSNGFVNPLVYIMTLRRVMSSGMQPHVYNSLRYYAADCVLASDAAPANIFNAYPTLHALLDDDTFHDGFTSIFTTSFPRGTLSSCLEAAGFLKTNMTAWATVPFMTPAGTNMLVTGLGNNILQGASEMGQTAVLASGGGTGAAAVVTPTSTDAGNATQALLDIVGRTSLASAADVAAISASLAFTPGLADGLMCGTPTPGVSMTDVNTCALMSSDQDELARLIESARGAGFSRVMISSMGVFQAIWIALAPLIMLTILAHGAKGPKIFGSYLLLGLWVVSWLPVAYMVNYYIDLSFRQAVSQLGGSGATFNLSQVYSLYRVAADKISVASDLMGAVPVLTMAVLSGSIYAMTKVAGTTMPRPEGFNANTGHMALAATQGGLAAMAPRFQQLGYSAAAGEGFGKSGVQQDSIDYSAAGQHRVEQAARVAQGTEQTLGRTVESAISTETGTRRTDSKGWGVDSTYTKALGQSRESAEQVGRRLLNDLGFKEEAKDSAKAEAAGDVALKAGLSVLGTGASAAVLGRVIKGRDLSAGEVKSLSEQMDKSKAWKDTWREGYEARGSLTEAQRQTLDRTTGLSETDRDAVQRAYRENQAAQLSLQNAQAFATTLGVGGKTTTTTLAANLTSGEVQTFDRVADLARGYGTNPERTRMLNQQFGGDASAAGRFATQYGMLADRAVSYGGQGFLASPRHRAALAQMAFIQSGDPGGQFNKLLEETQRNTMFLQPAKATMPEAQALGTGLVPHLANNAIQPGQIDAPVGANLDPKKLKVPGLSAAPGVDAANRGADRMATRGGIPTGDPLAGKERVDALAAGNEKRLRTLKVDGHKLSEEQIKEVGGSVSTQASGVMTQVEGGWDDFSTKHPAVAAVAVAAFEVAPIAKGFQLMRGAKAAAAGGEAMYAAGKNVAKDVDIIADQTKRLAAVSAKNGGIRTPDVVAIEREIATTTKHMSDHLRVMAAESGKKGGGILGKETADQLNRSFNTVATLGAAYDAGQAGAWVAEKVTGDGGHAPAPAGTGASSNPPTPEPPPREAQVAPVSEQRPAVPEPAVASTETPVAKRMEPETREPEEPLVPAAAVASQVPPPPASRAVAPERPQQAGDQPRRPAPEERPPAPTTGTSERVPRQDRELRPIAADRALGGDMRSWGPAAVSIPVTQAPPPAPVEVTTVRNERIEPAAREVDPRVQAQQVNPDAAARIEQLALNADNAALRAGAFAGQATIAADRATAAAGRVVRGDRPAPVKEEAPPPSPVAGSTLRTMRDISDSRERKGR